MELETIQVPRVLCEAGVEVVEDVAIEVVKTSTGTTAGAWILLFNVMSELAKSKLCGDSKPTTTTQLTTTLQHPGEDFVLQQNSKEIHFTTTLLVDGVGRRFGYDLNSQTDDKFEIGAFAFGKDGKWMQEHQIQWLNQFAEVPEGITHLRVWVAVGYQLAISEVYAT